jgi:hypothetical protein
MNRKNTTPQPPPASAFAPGTRMPLARHEMLRTALPDTVALLQRRRADLIDSSLIDDYVTLNWLEWHGGGLRLTVTGANVCAQRTLRES